MVLNCTKKVQDGYSQFGREAKPQKGAIALAAVEPSVRLTVAQRPHDFL